jgi:ABC-2 type transport system ATP-binding protein
MSQSKYAVETKGLQKTYVTAKKLPGVMGGIKSLFSTEKTLIPAVKGIDLQISPGEFVGFLGPNGAGKTTTLKMLSGILHPSGGTASVLGFEPWRRNHEMLKQISLVMGNKMQLWWDLPARDGFRVLKELYEVPDAVYAQRVDRLIDILDLRDKVDVAVRKLSLGERMKCELVAALIHQPQVVFLDEPTIGLDVVSQKRIRDFLRDLNQTEGTTILLTSHYMQDVQELCDRVVVIDHGEKVFEGTLDLMAAQFADSRRVRLTLSQPVENLETYGKVVLNEFPIVVFEVLRQDTARRTAELLQALPVVDVAIEEVEMDEILRDLFTRTAA